jgi:hypothetical protein
VNRLLGALVFLLAGVVSCGPQLTVLGPRRPAHRPGCAVQIVLGTPAAPFVDLASTRTKCLETARADCLDELRDQACAVGGDTVYGLSEASSQHITSISAMLAVRGQAESGAGGSAAGAAACTPICSPGFDCQAGRCVPLCNPACAPSEICNVHRACEPATPPAAMPPAAGPPT